MGAIVVSVFVLLIGIGGTIYFHIAEKKSSEHSIGMPISQ